MQRIKNLSDEARCNVCSKVQMNCL